MPRYAWKTEYAIGMPEIDAQHRCFLDLVDRLSSGAQAADGPDAGLSSADRRRLLLDELEQYARFHFTSEENRMAMAGYPFLHRHRQEHRHLLERFLAMRAESCDSAELELFLINWFVGHTREEDVAMARFLAPPLCDGEA